MHPKGLLNERIFSVMVNQDIYTLNNISIASPCPADWNEMRGNAQVRFCDHCNLNVYNLSGMSQESAEALLMEKQGTPLCVRLYRRADGTVITQDCPVGLQVLHRQALQKLNGFSFKNMRLSGVASILLVTVTGVFTLQGQAEVATGGRYPGASHPTLHKSPQPVMGDMVPVKQSKPNSLPGTIGMPTVPPKSPEGLPSKELPPVKKSSTPSVDSPNAQPHLLLGRMPARTSDPQPLEVKKMESPRS
jgi:hypothetical protein